jgi:hypothetical protein
LLQPAIVGDLGSLGLYLILIDEAQIDQRFREQ